MKTKPSTEYAILGSVFSGPRHGYEILKFINDNLNSIWHIAPSQLYAILKRLENGGLLDSTRQEQSSRPSKRVFSLRTAGKNRFVEWLHAPNRHVRDLRIEFLAKLFFFKNLDIPGAKALVNSQINLLEISKKRLEHNLKGQTDPFVRLSISFKIETIDARLNWLHRDAREFVKEKESLLKPIFLENSH